MKEVIIGLCVILVIFIFVIVVMTLHQHKKWTEWDNDYKETMKNLKRRRPF